MSLRPHRKTITLRMSQGIQARMMSSRAGAARAGADGGGSLPLRVVESQRLRGCQILRKPKRQAIDTTEDTTSTRVGPCKFDMRYCGTAKETPVTRIAGQISFMPRKPAKAQISQNGTMSEKNGNCRPTMADN